MMSKATALASTLCLLALAGDVDAATIYLCRAYGGGEFWSSDHCNKRSALIVRMASVPDGMPFEQQVQIVSQELRRTESLQNQEAQERSRLQQCGQLKAEKDGIWSRYSTGQYQPNEVVGPDRMRWKVIEAEQRRLNCPQR